MRYEFVGHTAAFILENPKRDQPSKRYVSVAGIAVSLPTIKRFFDAVCRQTCGHSHSRQAHIIAEVLRPFLAFFRQGGATYPVNADDWQRLLLNFLRFYLIDRTFSKKSVETRIQTWRGAICPVLTFWIEEEIIPRDVYIPRIDFKSEPVAASDAPLLGRRSTKTVNAAVAVQKLLVDVGFAQNDADYLDRIEQDCRSKVATLRDVCLKHWKAMRADHRTGDAMAAQVTATQIDTCLQEGSYRRTSPGGGPITVTHASLPDGHAWALAIAKRFLQAGPGINCITLKTLRESPLFMSSTFCSWQPNGLFYPALSTQSAGPSYASSGARSIQFYRFLGILSPVDAAATCCLLMIEHPQFTPFSIANAQLFDARGRLYLEATDVEGKARFSVDKPRAGTRKYAVLSPLAQEIVTDLVDITSPIRTLMRRSGHKAWRYLFLGLQNTMGHLGPFNAKLAKYLTKGTLNSLVRLYPELVERGLGRGTLDFRRLRKTLGVIRWFETGSIVEMSRCLGNSRQVVLEHYLPPALLHAWNTRIIRRFQNTLIILAAHEEDYLLAVTDFTTLGDLLHFMAQLLNDHRDGSSPIATQIHASIGPRIQADVPSTVNFANCGDQRLLNIRCSVQTLSFLYAFDEYAAGLTTTLRDRVDPLTGLCAQQFIDLSRMIRHACENPDVSVALREQLDIEPLRRVHRAALACQAELRVRFSHFSLNSRWETRCAGWHAR